MKIIEIDKLIQLLSSTTPKKIGIFDNNTISFLENIDELIDIEKILTNYDLLIVPNWVYREVKDSAARMNYLENLLTKNVDIYIIDETSYEELVKYKTVWLYKFFLYSSWRLGEVKSFIKRNIEKNQPLENLESYNVWLNLLYKNGFEGERLKNGRIKKKNAGEISISVVALLISYIYFKNNHTITILSNDRDTYDFIKSAKSKLMKDNMFKQLESSIISFKSNDCIIKEIYLHDCMRSGKNISSIIRFRDEKRVKFTINALDSSVEEHDEVLSSENFIKNLDNNSFNIIF
ncbi:hypothetical protein [Clostridium tyrobutyricum]|jgi:hypothetical protein|uniref:hypothetical protein n=1 Tax=Clostridium tyrobutyricum TaxID=1519 RepID=UPI0010AB4A75|nr:hypothetical protein [Clostridium tyrobutyricum]MBR9647948.1 hypothetical protein [Clostridium tyrobutyricum]QCH27028.1 hypothetical protein EZN00_00617 [Clostridium tyrobutyricum]